MEIEIGSSIISDNNTLKLGINYKRKLQKTQTQGDWGIGMVNTCKPMAVSFQCTTKFTTNKKIEKKTTTRF